MRWTRTRRPEAGRDGCGFLLLTCVFTCFLLILNCVAVARFFPELIVRAPTVLQDPRVEQTTMFVAPVVMIFVEWWLVDLIVELVTPRRKP